jgi:hypothetical protein
MWSVVRGDVTLVEFFDYNCGYCKRALGDLKALMQADPKLRACSRTFRCSARSRWKQAGLRRPSGSKSSRFSSLNSSSG